MTSSRQREIGNSKTNKKEGRAKQATEKLRTNKQKKMHTNNCQRKERKEKSKRYGNKKEDTM